MKYRILFMADTQLSSKQPINRLDDIRIVNKVKFERMAEIFNKLQCDFTIHYGDLLESYKGDIESFKIIEQYISDTNEIVLCESPPIRLQFPSMNVQGPLRDIKKYVSLSSETVEKASEQLRLKRTKYNSLNIHTIDKCINRV